MMKSRVVQLARENPEALALAVLAVSLLARGTVAQPQFGVYFHAPLPAGGVVEQTVGALSDALHQVLLRAVGVLGSALPR